MIVKVYEQLVAERADNDRNCNRNNDRNDDAPLINKTDPADGNSNRHDGALLMTRTNTVDIYVALL